MVDYSKILTKEYLEEHYIKLNKTAAEIQKELNLPCYGTVENYIRRHGLWREKRKPTKVHKELTKELLYEELVIKKGKIKDIAKKYNVHRKTIRERIQEYGLRKARKGDNLLSVNEMNGYKEINYTYWRQLKIDAQKRNKEFSINLEYAWQIWEQQESKCALTGIPLQFGKKEIRTASLDRIDNSKGYIVDNIQWVHKDINMIKQKFSIQHLVGLAHLIVDYTSDDYFVH